MLFVLSPFCSAGPSKRSISFWSAVGKSALSQGRSTAVNHDLHGRVHERSSCGGADVTIASSIAEQSLQPNSGMSFQERIAQEGMQSLRRFAPSTVQVNIGLYCNLACQHCHVESSPRRTEAMDERTARRIVELMRATPSLKTLDITGGAPEFNPNFRYLVEEAKSLNLEVLDRCNLTVLLEPGMEWTAPFLAQHSVHVVASLPCYLEDNVTKQRGAGVYSSSVEALLLLNSLGYAAPGSNLKLDLVYNPVGPCLPPAEDELESVYRTELRSRFGIEFNKLYTITNMPITRYKQFLRSRGDYDDYVALLTSHFNPATLDSLMCRHLVNISWDGSLRDCDFNGALKLPLGPPASKGLTVWDVSSFADDAVSSSPVRTGEHCFACTAGHGSSCTGALD